jgi:hypothetical protein
MGTNQELTFDIQRQQGDNWCWAAVTASVSYFYDNGTAWTQCTIACTRLNKNDCCPPRNGNPCDVQNRLDLALQITGNFIDPLLDYPLRFADVQQQIDSRKVVGARIQWANGFGHFVALHGYNDTTAINYLYVADPIFGKNIVNFDTFIRNYQQSGSSWTHSYLTKSAGLNMLQFTAINDNILKAATEVNPLHAKPWHDPIRRHIRLSGFIIIPHQIFLVDFQSLKAGGEPRIVSEGLRVIDNRERGKPCIDDFNNDEIPVLQRIIHDPQYVDPYIEVLHKIIRRLRRRKYLYSIRLIRQPELKMEAFWLHREDNTGRDEFIPYITTSLMRFDEVYARHNFFRILSEAASNKELLADDLMGG